MSNKSVDSLFLVFNDHVDNIQKAYNEFTNRLEELRHKIITIMNEIIKESNESVDRCEKIKLDYAQPDKKGAKDLNRLESGAQFQIRKGFEVKYMVIGRVRAVIKCSETIFDEPENSDKYRFFMIFNNESKKDQELDERIKLKLGEEQYYAENYMRVGTDNNELILAEFQIDDEFEDMLKVRMRKIIKDVLNNIS